VKRSPHADHFTPLAAWDNLIHHAEWSDTAAVKDPFRSASCVGDRVVFNIAGNKGPARRWN